MTNNEKVHIVAGFCRWKFELDPVEGRGEDWWIDPATGERGELPTYDTLDACAGFERVATGRGYGEDYYLALWDLIHPKFSLWDIVSDPECELPSKDQLAYLLAVHTATPAQRLKAILAVIEETRP